MVVKFKNIRTFSLDNVSHVFDQVCDQEEQGYITLKPDNKIVQYYFNGKNNIKPEEKELLRTIKVYHYINHGDSCEYYAGVDSVENVLYVCVITYHGERK